MVMYLKKVCLDKLGSIANSVIDTALHDTYNVLSIRLMSLR